MRGLGKCKRVQLQHVLLGVAEKVEKVKIVWSLEQEVDVNLANWEIIL